MTSFVPLLANLNIKRNVTSMFVNKKYRYKLERQLPLVGDTSVVIYNAHAKLGAKSLEHVTVSGSMSCLFVSRASFASKWYDVRLPGFQTNGVPMSYKVTSSSFERFINSTPLLAMQLNRENSKNSKLRDKKKNNVCRAYVI